MIRKSCVFIFASFILFGMDVRAYDYVKDGFRPLQPVQTNSSIDKVKSYPNITRLERDVFKRSYENDTPENRIARLEEQVLGTVFEGDLNSRYKVLKKTIPNYIRSQNIATTNYYPSYSNTYTSTSYPNSYYSTPVMSTNSGWRGLAGSLGNFLFGTPTGMSPQIYSPYINNYGPDYQRGMYSNQGWNVHNVYTGSGAGIRMLP